MWALVMLLSVMLLAIVFLLWVLVAVSRESSHRRQFQVHLYAFPHQEERAVSVLVVEDDLIAASEERLSARWSLVLG